MRPRERRETGEQDLFRSRLDRIIDLTQALVKLSCDRLAIFGGAVGGGFSSRSRRASDRALPDFDSPFYAGCMLVRPDDRGIDGMLLVSCRPNTRQDFECRVPHADLARACEAHKD